MQGFADHVPAAAARGMATRTTHVNGIVDDASMALSLAEQRVKGILIGVAVGAIGTAILAYLYGGPVLALVGAGRKSNPAPLDRRGRRKRRAKYSADKRRKLEEYGPDTEPASDRRPSPGTYAYPRR